MSRLDKALHDLYFDLNVEDGGINWNTTTLGSFSWYYAENSLYLVRHNKTNSLHLIKTSDPMTAVAICCRNMMNNNE